MIGLGTFSSDYVANNAYPALRYMIITESMSYRSLDGMRDTACVGMPFNGLNIPRFFYRVAGPPMDNPLLLAGEIHDHICFMARSLPAGPGLLRSAAASPHGGWTAGARLEFWAKIFSGTIDSASPVPAHRLPRTGGCEESPDWYPLRPR